MDQEITRSLLVFNKRAAPMNITIKIINTPSTRPLFHQKVKGIQT